MEDECGDFRIADLDCETEIEDGSVEYRSIDGTCNNRRRPYYGAANIAFRRSCLHKSFTHNVMKKRRETNYQILKR